MENYFATDEVLVSSNLPWGAIFQFYQSMVFNSSTIRLGRKGGDAISPRLTILILFLERK